MKKGVAAVVLALLWGAGSGLMAEESEMKGPDVTSPWILDGGVIRTSSGSNALSGAVGGWPGGADVELDTSCFLEQWFLVKDGPVPDNTPHPLKPYPQRIPLAESNPWLEKGMGWSIMDYGAGCHWPGPATSSAFFSLMQGAVFKANAYPVVARYAIGVAHGYVHDQFPWDDVPGNAMDTDGTADIGLIQTYDFDEAACDATVFAFPYHYPSEDGYPCPVGTSRGRFVVQAAAGDACDLLKDYPCNFVSTKDRDTSTYAEWRVIAENLTDSQTGRVTQGWLCLYETVPRVFPGGKLMASAAGFLCRKAQGSNPGDGSPPPGQRPGDQ